jgi:hypothetical protein
MFTYHAKTTYNGWKIGEENYNLYIGVPKKYLFGKNGIPRTIEIEHNGRIERVGIEESVKEEEQIQQLNTQAKHILVYFLWEERDENI